MERFTCTECGHQFTGDGERQWLDCEACYSILAAKQNPHFTVNISLGPQPHLMSEGEYAMHMRNKRDIEKRVRAGEGIEFKEKGPLEFRPKP